MKGLLISLILGMQFIPATLAQSSFPFNRFSQPQPETSALSPEPSSALYRSLIFHGTRRVEGTTEIWTEDKLTVRISTNIKKSRVMFVANDYGLQEVWISERKNYRVARAPKKIVISNTVTREIVRKGVKVSLPGHPDIRVTVVVKPSDSADAAILRKRFAKLVDKYGEDQSFH
jgi:hypothetical protein